MASNSEPISKPPAISVHLVEYLDAQFPLRKPDIRASGREIWRDVGSRDVVDHLKRLLEDQNEANVLTSS